MSKSEKVVWFPLLALMVLFWVMTMAAIYDVGLVRGKNLVRFDACVSTCDAKAFDIEPDEYVDCLGQCKEWRCER